MKSELQNKDLKSGKRVRECRIQLTNENILNGKYEIITQEKLAEAIDCSTNQISYIECGRRKLSLGLARSMASIFHVRPEYLLGEDDFRTEEDIRSCQNDMRIKDMQAALNYLRSLGLYLIPYNILYCSVTGLFKNLSILTPYIQKDALEQLKQEYDFTLSTSDFFKKYYGENCSVELSSPLPDMPFLRTEELAKGLINEQSLYVDCSDKRNLIRENCEIALYFKIYYNNKFVRTISENNLQDFVKKLDAYTKCTIETILF